MNASNSRCAARSSSPPSTACWSSIRHARQISGSSTIPPKSLNKCSNRATRLSSHSRWPRIATLTSSSQQLKPTAAPSKIKPHSSTSAKWPPHPNSLKTIGQMNASNFSVSARKSTLCVTPYFPKFATNLFASRIKCSNKAFVKLCVGCSNWCPPSLPKFI